MKLNNAYYILRHGEAISNVKGICSCWPETFENPLTENGVQMINRAALELEDKGIQLIFASDVLRTKQTAQIVGKELNIKPKFDKRLREVDFGIMNGAPMANLDMQFPREKERIFKAIPKGETYRDVHVRVYDFLRDMDEQFQGKTILVVSHECPLLLLEAVVNGVSLGQLFNGFPRHERIRQGELKKLN